MSRELIMNIIGWAVIACVVVGLVFASPRIRQMQVNKAQAKAQEQAKKRAMAFGRPMTAVEEMEKNIEQQVNEDPAENTEE